ncbi:hypothetical protein HYH02_005641 [Chlamydomonas schloesseri]|uniref:Rhamnosyl O-methyltransferase n=1 Tax=Chlamydomonas schloesseri TaxID=2026947 RepID=A0A836B711_9CHLO|nr:hypothetical protein HYH02_005641 [Chlamydomonas schloesseri]|eukprot:KAG2449497.1 hypothetical protein HYH02_005641 [Chlamydomonas schloesseri]
MHTRSVAGLLLPLLLAVALGLTSAQDRGGQPRLRRLPDAAVTIDLYEVLGPDAYSKGVIWQPDRCYAPVSQRMDGQPTEARVAKLEAMLEQDLILALSKATGRPVQGLNRTVSFPQLYGTPGFDQLALESDHVYRKKAMRAAYADPAYWRWLELASEVVNRYTVSNRDPVTGQLPMVCPNATVTALVGNVSRASAQVDCANASSIIAEMGYFLDPHIQIKTISGRVIRDPGWCSVRWQYSPYAKWVKQERLMKRLAPATSPSDGSSNSSSSGTGSSSSSSSLASPFAGGQQRFRFDNRHKDRLVFLFDMMYEISHAFKNQHWLGAVVQQNPFDMYVITDLISRLRPALIIETGTANGGSALLWASMLELNSLADSTTTGSSSSTTGSSSSTTGSSSSSSGYRPRVITLDVNAPELVSWAGINTFHPVNNSLWAKYVTFIKGSSVGQEALTQVRAAAAAAAAHGPVLVLLDSDHTQEHVLLEAKHYCPLVTPGSYCIVEDTKLSRFSVVDGPTPAIARFLAAHPELGFQVDRVREPFYTQHVGGYLFRRPAAAAAGNKVRRALQQQAANTAAAAAATAATAASVPGSQPGGEAEQQQEQEEEYDYSDEYEDGSVLLVPGEQQQLQQQLQQQQQQQQQAAGGLRTLLQVAGGGGGGAGGGGGGGGGGRRVLPQGVIPINLYELLGPSRYSHGVAWQPLTCYAAVADHLKGASDGAARLAKLEAALEKELLAALSEVTGTPLSSLNGGSSFPLASGLAPGLNQALIESSWDTAYSRAALRRVSADPRYWRWQRSLTAALSRHMVLGVRPGSGARRVACPSEQVKALLGTNLEDTPGITCGGAGSAGGANNADASANEAALLEAVGLFPYAQSSVRSIVERVMRQPGWCSAHPAYNPYGLWLKKARITAPPSGPNDIRFNVSDSHQDRVLFLFDLLYEAEAAFKRQYWLGAVAQQNPFDMYALTDIIHHVQPDLIIETGTANGGSALIWSSVLELMQYSYRNGSSSSSGNSSSSSSGSSSPAKPARVLTVDLVHPTKAHWAGEGHPTSDPTQHPLWKKYVTFIEGSSTSPPVLQQLREAAAAAARVVVFLDSGHEAKHVREEMDALCGLVTNGSYCVVQDTKISRFSAFGGPRAAVSGFLRDHGHHGPAARWRLDREREPFYTHHPGGYLQRVAP